VASRARPWPPATSSSGAKTEAKKLTGGKFITLEGGEGAGKSTQQKRLLEELSRAGKDTLGTREPGGAKGADEIRRLLVNGTTDRWDATSEALLMIAARRSHLVETVWPALQAGKWVVCDRFVDSTTAYQGYGGALALDQLAALHRLIADDFMPDLTFILDVPVEIGLKRAAKRHGGEARFEGKGLDYHERVREGFLTIAAHDQQRCVVIDASREPDAVTAEILAALRKRLDLAA
jgi:dTMP kinase